MLGWVVAWVYRTTRPHGKAGTSMQGTYRLTINRRSAAQPAPKPQVEAALAEIVLPARTNEPGGRPAGEPATLSLADRFDTVLEAGRTIVLQRRVAFAGDRAIQQADGLFKAAIITLRKHSVHQR